MAPITQQREYLGDSVYAAFDGFGLVLTTENGLSDDPSNTIVMNPEVLAALDRFRESLKAPGEEAGALPNNLGASITAAIRCSLEGAEWTRKTCTAGAAALAKVADKLSPDVDFNAYGGSFWFTVKNRDDVQTLMTLAPIWKKNAYEGGIDYNATIDGVEFKIRTVDGALPPTCRLVEQDVVVPARPAEPERIEKRMVVECSKATEATP